MKKFIILLIVIAIGGFIYYKNSTKINNLIFKNDVYRFTPRNYLRGEDGYKQYTYADINLKTGIAQLSTHMIISQGIENDYSFYDLKMTDEQIKATEELINDIKNNPSNYEYDENKIKNAKHSVYAEFTINGKVYTVVGYDETKILRDMVHSKGINSKNLEEQAKKNNK